MGHRYVAAIARRPNDPAFEDLLSRIDRRLAGWTVVLASRRTKVWVLTTGRTHMAFRRLPGGCLIGRDFPAPGAGEDEAGWGAYISILQDEKDHAVAVYRDPSGRIDCWRTEADGGDLLFSHLDDVAGLSRRPLRIDWDFLSFHLTQDYLHGEATGLVGVEEILPGQSVVYARGEVAKQMRWWPHEVAANVFPTRFDAQLAIREAAERAIGAWAKTYERIVLDLSGGLDSSIVLGLLRGSAQHPYVLGLNKISPGEEGDERRYAALAAEMHHIPIAERTPSSLGLKLSGARLSRAPRPRPRMLPIGYDEMGAEVGRAFDADAFFTGTGGDHLFFDHLPVVAAADVLDFSGAREPFLRTVGALARLSRSTVWQVFGAVAQDLLGQGRGLADLGPQQNRFLAPGVAAAADLAKHVHPWAIQAALSAPPGKLKQIVHLVELQNHYHRFGRAEIFDEVHPLLSQPVMEACLRTPAFMFAADGLQRGLARQAFADLLPEAIRTRRSKGGSTPYMIAFWRSRLPEMRELLLDGRLVERGLLNRDIMSDALTPMAVTAGRDQQSIITCLTTELWVRDAEARLSPAPAR